MLKKLFASKELKNAHRELAKINLLEQQARSLSDEALKAKTTEFKKRLEKGETLEELRVEAFTVVREATRRVLGKRLFDVQILGGIVLDMGSVAEMKTGEGKTLTSIAPVYLNALKGESVIVVTVNEYLAERDAEEMGKVHTFLGLTVGVNLKTLSPGEKKMAYACDITYSVHSEVGFDYLRDNMVKKIEEKSQRGLSFVLVDEVDSVLIDEARTPLIISGGSNVPMQSYVQADEFVKGLSPDDYDIDWETKAISLNNSGVEKARKHFKVENIFSIDNSELVHRVSNSLRANYIMHRDADYIIREDKLEIVDAFTGRIMEGRSFSDGLHQALQAKENVTISPENTTLATVTYQNFFRMFKKLSGMSGTAKTEENEFIEIYNMRVHSIPTNKPMIRIDHPDAIYVTNQAKYNTIIEQVRKCYDKGQPVLLGTEEVSESEKISKMLINIGLPHTVLNAKQNEQEAEIIARAGEFKAITIATNMAGRGTDIKPTPQSIKVGGLFVIGTSKAESRRIDNQLRGRSGRQGDIGESRFIISLEDKLFTRFSNQEKLKKAFSSFGENTIKGKAIFKALERAQVRIEGFNFESRKNVLQYDDVIRQQRDLIYAQRDIIISHEDLYDVIERMIKSVVRDLVTIPTFDSFRKEDKSIDSQKFVTILNGLWFKLTDFKLKHEQFINKTNDEYIAIVSKAAIDVYQELRTNVIENINESNLHEIERTFILTTFDHNWQLHIDRMSRLRSSTNLASYAQKNPFQVYVEKGAEHFKDLLLRISHNTIKQLFANSYAIKKPSEVIVPKAHEQIFEEAHPAHGELTQKVVHDAMENHDHSKPEHHLQKSKMSDVKDNENDHA